MDFLAAKEARRRPVVCYNLDDPRGFAFWSDPTDWVGRDGVMVMINDDYTPFSFHERWFESYRPLDEFWVERSGKPVRRVRIFRFTNQLAALPYQFTPAQAAERTAIRASSGPQSATARVRRSRFAMTPAPAP